MCVCVHVYMFSAKATEVYDQNVHCKYTQILFQLSVQYHVRLLTLYDLVLW